MVRIPTLTATAINLGLLAVSAFACMEIYAITTKMMVLVGRGPGFLPFGAIFGGTFLLPWLVLLVIISAMATGIRLPLGMLFLITGILGWNQGYWHYETIDYLNYDPEHHLRPSGYAQLVSGGINAGLIFWAIVLVFFRKQLRAATRKTIFVLTDNSYCLYSMLTCISLLLTTAVIVPPIGPFSLEKGLYCAGIMVVIGIFLTDSILTPRRGNGPLIFFSMLAISLAATVYLVFYLALFRKIPSIWFGISWFYVHRILCIIAGIILLSIPARILIHGNRKRRKGISPRITTEPNSLA